MDKTLVLKRIKTAYRLKNDAMLAVFLGIKPNTLTGWYKRNSINLELIFYKCEHISFDWLFTGIGEMFRNYPKTNEKCKLCAEKNEVISELKDRVEEQKNFIDYLMNKPKHAKNNPAPLLEINRKKIGVGWWLENESLV
ncbi:MAG: helix-turn-helix domain containing protein [Lentimicrobiaceae bacterium]|nr:helix-turn-helix domain containing protein [Lentimicrobiaceae bacterium]